MATVRNRTVATSRQPAPVVVPDKASWWRTTRAAILAAGPVITLAVLSNAAVSYGPRSATIGALVLCAAWSPLIPAGAHALLCVDERAEILPWAPTLLRELLAWPVMLVSGRARAETWASTLGVAAAAAYWALSIGW